MYRLRISSIKLDMFAFHSWTGFDGSQKDIIVANSVVNASKLEAYDSRSHRIHSASSARSPKAQNASRYVEYRIPSTILSDLNECIPALCESKVRKKYLSPYFGLMLYILPTTC